MQTATPLNPSRSRSNGCARISMSQLFWSMAFFVSLGLGTVALHRLPLPPAGRYLVPIIPMVAGFFYIRAMVRDIHSQMDELQRLIYLEAAAVTVCGLFIAMLAY